MDKKKFFDKIRPLFGGKLSQPQVNNIEAILKACSDEKISDQRHIAYILATAFHECYHIKYNKDFNPIREGFAASNSGAIAQVTKLFKAGKIKTNYALPRLNGKSYYGRGYGQITGPGNYRNMGKILGIDLYNNPDLALNPANAAKILVKGMLLGTFTGHKLSTYFNSKLSDDLNARRIINGTDQAERIAAYAKEFNNALV